MLPDAECLRIIVEVLTKLGLKNFEIRVGVFIAYVNHLHYKFLLGLITHIIICCLGKCRIIWQFDDPVVG